MTIPLTREMRQPETLLLAVIIPAALCGLFLVTYLVLDRVYQPESQARAASPVEAVEASPVEPQDTFERLGLHYASAPQTTRQMVAEMTRLVEYSRSDMSAVGFEFALAETMADFRDYEKTNEAYWYSAITFQCEEAFEAYQKAQKVRGDLEVYPHLIPYKEKLAGHLRDAAEAVRLAEELLNPATCEIAMRRYAKQDLSMTAELEPRPAAIMEQTAH